MSVEQRQFAAINRISALVVINAMIFQEILAQKDERVQTLRILKGGPDPVAAFIDHWNFILTQINYYPIFYIANELLRCLAADRGAANAVNQMAETAREIVSWRASLRHDLAGRIYHKILAEAKYLGAFYTSIPASVLLLKLTLDMSRWNLDWSDVDALRQFRVADLACGTGTLLMAAADAIVDNHIWSCVQKQQPQLVDKLQSVIIQEIIYGLDVLPSAVHLTASTLALRVPELPVNVTNLWSLPLGSEEQRLGSLEFLEDRAITAARLFAPLGKRVEGTRVPERHVVEIPELDLCVMNPPFTSSREPNLLFGNIPGRRTREDAEQIKGHCPEAKCSCEHHCWVGCRVCRTW